MSRKLELSRQLSPRMLWGPVADPGPPFLIRWWEEFTKEQRRVIVGKEIEQRIAEVKFGIESLKAELSRLETMRSMIKGKG